MNKKTSGSSIAEISDDMLDHFKAVRRIVGEEMAKRMYPAAWIYLQRVEKHVGKPSVERGGPTPTIVGPDDSIPARLNQINQNR